MRLYAALFLNGFWHRFTTDWLRPHYGGVGSSCWVVNGSCYDTGWKQQMLMPFLCVPAWLPWTLWIVVLGLCHTHTCRGHCVIGVRLLLQGEHHGISIDPLVVVWHCVRFYCPIEWQVYGTWLRFGIFAGLYRSYYRTLHGQEARVNCRCTLMRTP